MAQYRKSFRNWKTQQVEQVFGIKRSKDKSKLLAWENADCDIMDKERASIIALQNYLVEKVDYWNEATFKFFFLGPFISLIHYETDKYSSFLEASLSLQLSENKRVAGNVDFLVATGYQIPEVPFFTLHEYKADANTSMDPAGQLLISMVVAQKANKAKGIEHPLYGVYVVGRLWYFVILDGQHYMKTLAYDSTKADIFNIFCMLRQVKAYIDELVEGMG